MGGGGREREREASRGAKGRRMLPLGTNLERGPSFKHRPEARAPASQRARYAASAKT